MPELPDVEVFRRYFQSTALHRRIERTHVTAPELLRSVTPQGLGRALKGAAFQSTSRHGKYLFADLGRARWLVLHFGMSGSLEHLPDGSGAPEHTRCTFAFDDGSALAYVAPRKLGLITLTECPDCFVRERKLGADAARLDLDRFAALADGSRASVKSWLMNQQTLAGIGNIYSDEILFQAGIHPRRVAGDLDERALRRLHRALRSVLESAVAARADPQRMPARFLLPHRVPGGRCPRCGGPLEKSRAGGRSAWHCPSCQPR